MKCPECLKAGLRSTVHTGGGVTTAMGGDRYYDEDGKLHDHDPNSTTWGGTCSNGHSFHWTTQRKCPNCAYGKSSPQEAGGPQ